MLNHVKKIVIISLIAMVSTVLNADVVIKLATVAPKDSIWHTHLKKIDQRWQHATDGQVKLRIYAGTLGDEDDILRRVRVGQLDAAAISTAGLSSIDRATQAMHIPLAFISNEEMEYVRNGVAKQLELLLAAKHFKVLTWAEVGWVHFFTKEPVVTPDDLRKQKLFVWSNGDSARSEKLWQDRLSGAAAHGPGQSVVSFYTLYDGSEVGPVNRCDHHHGKSVAQNPRPVQAGNASNHG